MAKLPSEQQTHTSLLMELGFPERVAHSAGRAVGNGLFDLEPSADLVMRTVEACQAVVASGQVAGRSPRATVAGTDEHFFHENQCFDLRSETGGAVAPVLSSVARLITECAAMVDFVHQTGQRPMTLLDNHNVVEPDWWSTDTGFLAVRDTLKTANEAAREVNAAPAAVFMILRPQLEDYDAADFKSIRCALVGHSDVWIVPYSLAGECRNVGGLFFGGGHAVTLQGRCDTSGAAFSAFREVSSQSAKVFETAFCTMTRGTSMTHKSSNIGTSLDSEAELRSVFKEAIEAEEIVQFAA